MKLFGKYKGIAYLTLLLIILPLAIWSLALKGTVSKYREYRKEGQKLKAIRDRPADGETPAWQKTGEDGIDFISGGKFIEAISPCVEKNRLAIEKYTPYLTHQGDGIMAMTAGIEVSGEFGSIVRLVDFIEKDIKPCRLLSLDFRSIRDRRTGNIKLTAVIYIQQVITY